MQKKLIALAVAGLASTAAFAQTNVTIYGIADVGAVVFDGKTGHKGVQINSGVLSTSRLGFKGVEDLGNGLKALFTLEYGLATDSNTGIGTGTAAGRQQFVGLTGGFGTLVGGRLQTAGLDFTVAGSALGASSALGAINNVNLGSALGVGLINAAGRANNAVAYISPSFGGATLAVNYAREPLGTETGAGNVSDATAMLVALNYANGPISAGAVYGVYDNNDSLGLETAGITATTLGYGLTPAQIAAAQAAVQLDKAKEWGVRGGYDLGVAKLQAAYQAQKIEDITGDSLKGNKWVVSATVPLGKAALIAEYAQSKYDNATANDNKNKAFTVAGTYSLSKRTTAYAGYVGVRPEDGTQDLNVFAAGLRHSF